MSRKLGGGLKIRGTLTAREQSPQQNNRMQPEAQRSKKGAPRPLAKLLIHHDSWAARWAFLNQMVLELLSIAQRHIARLFVAVRNAFSLVMRQVSHLSPPHLLSWCVHSKSKSS